MEMAVDLFRAGVEVLARETDHAAAAAMRTVCPDCMERVHLVERETGSYFAHAPRAAGSPPCALRVDSGGASASHGGRHETLPPNTRFRDALLAAYSLSEPPQPPAGGADAARAAALLHRVYQAEGRSVTAADLADASPLVRGWWTSDEGMIRGFLDHPGVVSERLREDLRDHPELKSDEHRRSVLLLWKHLHSPQVADDLVLLLHTTAHLFRPLLLADLVLTSLGVLAWVPWTALRPAAPTPVCGECGGSVTTPESESVVCSECGKLLCPDCANPCSGCGDVLCEHCIFRTCPACSETLCSVCWHFEWQCLSCETWYCEGGLEEQPEEVDKTECDDCGEPFCPDCVEEALRDWAGDMICESCWDERVQDHAAAVDDPG